MLIKGQGWTLGGTEEKIIRTGKERAESSRSQCRPGPRMHDRTRPTPGDVSAPTSRKRAGAEAGQAGRTIPAIMATRPRPTRPTGRRFARMIKITEYVARSRSRCTRHPRLGRRDGGAQFAQPGRTFKLSARKARRYEGRVTRTSCGRRTDRHAGPGSESSRQAGCGPARWKEPAREWTRVQRGPAIGPRKAGR